MGLVRILRLVRNSLVELWSPELSIRSSSTSKPLTGAAVKLMIKVPLPDLLAERNAVREGIVAGKRDFKSSTVPAPAPADSLIPRKDNEVDLERFLIQLARERSSMKRAVHPDWSRLLIS
jgi:hypothetical protein